MEIVERLRSHQSLQLGDRLAAADEIERLRAELAECKMSLGAIHAMVDRVSTQVVRAECERAVPELADLAAKEKK